MRIQSKLVYDEFLAANATAYTNDDLSDFLGMYDQISIQAVVDQTTSPGVLTVRIEHCADGRNFVNKSSGPTGEIDGVGTGPGYGSFASGTTTTLTGVDQGLLPSLGFVRLKIGSPVDVHVKIHVTMRDQTGATPGPPDTVEPSREALVANALGDAIQLRARLGVL